MEKVKDIIPDYNDGDFLCPKSGAKLASLFGLDRAESQGNESFQFTAPKQPKKSCAKLGGPPPQKSIPPPCAPAVLFAAAVHAFSFVNGQYVKQGKIGAAVLGNHVTKEYKILLYDSKQKQISTARIHRGFVLTVQPYNYVTFYDDQQQNWSLMFDSAKSRPEFCKEVCVARWNSEALSDSLVTQDLVQGEGQAVDVGDTVEVAYSGWLLQNHSLGQVFDSNLGKEKLQRVKVGAGKAQRGWEDGMLGMQKGGRRLLIVPPSMGHGSKGVLNHVQANSTLVFDVEIHRVQFSKVRRSRESVDTFSTSPSTPKENTSQSIYLYPYSFRQNPYFPTQLDSFASVYPSQHFPYQTPDITSFLMSDARQHNTEILLAIEKLARRVDQLSCKVDELQKEGHLSFRLSSVSLETNMILHNIQRIIQERKCHKSSLFQVHLSGELDSSTTQAHQLQQEALNSQQRAEKQKCKQMEDIIQNTDEEMQDLRAEKENLDQILSDRKRKWQVEQVDGEWVKSSYFAVVKCTETELVYLVQVKRLLNGVFQSLRTEFDSQESYSGHTVLEILQNTIKSITVKLLSEPRELESGIDEDKVEEEYLSTEECLQIKHMKKENNEIAGKGQH
ncbi:FK506-binding protein 15 [Sinocyclocheilus grahami]|uniref:FK506-binding protein 15 n=1 Tax=Sinocyclocheilus grahami TaxID=75366 RepID=UPI0007AD2DAC|nr:PREDICTED: FK506-binding protein 15-like [Sinocyclocheilus grahami]